MMIWSGNVLHVYRFSISDVLTFQGSLVAKNMSYETNMEGVQRPPLLYEMMGKLVTSNYPLNYYAVTGVGCIIVNV